MKYFLFLLFAVKRSTLNCVSFLSGYGSIAKQTCQTNWELVPFNNPPKKIESTVAEKGLFARRTILHYRRERVPVICKKYQESDFEIRATSHWQTNITQ